MLSRIIRPTGKQLLGVTAIAGVVALLILITATAALAGVWLPGQQTPGPSITIERIQATPQATPQPRRTPVAAPRVSPPANTPRQAPAAPQGVWDRLAACESGGNWGANTGNGYHGGLQFLNSTWRMAGGTRYAPMACQATREQQIAVASSWLARTSWAQWPACSRRLGLR